MIMKNQELCRQCFFGWYPSGNAPRAKAYCEYYLVTGKQRENTEKTCKCYMKGSGKGQTVDEKKDVYRELVRHGRI